MIMKFYQIWIVSETKFSSKGEKKKKKPAAATEEEDDGMPKEPKSKDPRTALPKGTFDLERFYSNNAWWDTINAEC